MIGWIAHRIDRRREAKRRKKIDAQNRETFAKTFLGGGFG